MKKSEVNAYKAMNPIAVMAITNNCGMAILEIENGIDDYVVVKGFTGDIHRYKLHETNKGSFFKYQNGCRYYIHDFMKVA